MESNQLVKLKWNTHHSTLLSNLESYLNSENMVDCTLAAEGHYIRAHKIILCSCSPYFQELLSVDTEKHPIIYLHNVKYAELQALLSYMYRGEINIDQDNVPGFLRIAESLQMYGIFNSSSETNSNNDNRPSTINADVVEEVNQENDDEVEDDNNEEQQQQQDELQELIRDRIFNNKSMNNNKNQIAKDPFELSYPTIKLNKNNHKSDNNGGGGSSSSSSSSHNNIIINDRKRALPRGGRRSSSSSTSSSSTTTATATNQANNNNHMIYGGSNNNNNSNHTQQQQQQVPQEMNPQLHRTRKTDVIFNDFLDNFASGLQSNDDHSHPKQPKLDQNIRTPMTQLLSTIASPTTPTTTSTTTTGKSGMLPSSSSSQIYRRRHAVIPSANNNNTNNNNSRKSTFTLINNERSSGAPSSSSSSNTHPYSFVKSGFYVPDLQHNNELMMTRENNVNPFDENSTNPDEEDDDQIQDELNSGGGGEPSFRCVKCGKQYTSNKSLWRHRKFTCDGKQIFSCHLCGKSFSRSDNLRRHAVVAHSAQ